MQLKLHKNSDKWMYRKLLIKSKSCMFLWLISRRCDSEIFNEDHLLQSDCQIDLWLKIAMFKLQSYKHIVGYFSKDLDEIIEKDCHSLANTCSRVWYIVDVSLMWSSIVYSCFILFRFVCWFCFCFLFFRFCLVFLFCLLMNIAEMMHDDK